MPKELTPALAKQIAEEEGFKLEHGDAAYRHTNTCDHCRAIMHAIYVDRMYAEKNLFRVSCDVLKIDTTQEYSKITIDSFRRLLQTAKGE